MQDKPKQIGLLWPMIIAVALGAPIVLTVLMLGNTPAARADRLFHIVKTFVYALSLAVVVIAAAFPIRMWRKRDATNEVVREVHDGTQRVKEIHYGAPPRYQISDGKLADPWVFPAMARAAYQAGVQAPEQRSYAPMGAGGGEPDWAMPSAAWDGDDVPAPVGWDGEIVQ